MFQRPDVTIAQGVEDELQLAPSGGDAADVAAAAVGDPLPQHPGRGARGDGLDRLDRGPADQAGALLGDPSAVDVGVGLMVLGSQPGPAGQLGAEAKRVMSPISATNTAPRVGPMPGMFWTAV